LQQGTSGFNSIQICTSTKSSKTLQILLGPLEIDKDHGQVARQADLQHVDDVVAEPLELLLALQEGPQDALRPVGQEGRPRDQPGLVRLDLCTSWMLPFSLFNS